MFSAMFSMFFQCFLLEMYVKLSLIFICFCLSSISAFSKKDTKTTSKINSMTTGFEIFMIPTQLKILSDLTVKCLSK